MSGACCWSMSPATPRAPTGARATYTEDEALKRIIDMFEAEVARPTDMGTTAPRSQQGH